MLLYMFLLNGGTPGHIHRPPKLQYPSSVVPLPQHRHTQIHSAKSPSLSADCEVIAVSIEEKACGARAGEGGAGG